MENILYYNNMVTHYKIPSQNVHRNTILYSKKKLVSPGYKRVYLLYTCTVCARYVSIRREIHTHTYI